MIEHFPLARGATPSSPSPCLKTVILRSKATKNLSMTFGYPE